MTAPTISSQRLVMRALTKASQRQIDWLRDKDVVTFSEQRHREHTLGSQLRYIQSFVGRSYIWSIHAVTDNRHIGNITSTVDEPNSVADIGILLGEKDFWGHGYGSEAWLAVCNWMLDKDCGKMRKLEAGCASCNVAMKKIIEKSKFQLEGERKNHLVIDGSPYGTLLYGRFR
jgi:RimJ/RimL family protein N-acetyltransferase